MSVSFHIKNKKKFFGYEKVLTVGEVVDLCKEYKLSIYNIDFNADDFNKEKFYNTSIESWQENHSCILFGVEGKSVRGFEFSYNTTKNSYVIREFIPASENDWFIVLEFMKVLSEKLNSKILSEQREIFTSGTINTYDYKSDIKSGIKAILDLLNKENEKGFNVDNIYGIKRPVSFDKEIIERIVNSSDEIKEFSKFCENIQYIDAYLAKQFFVDDKEHNKKWAYYVLIENLRTVLPYKPNVEIFSMNYIKNEEVAFWKIFFCAYKVDENGKTSIDLTNLLALIQIHSKSATEANEVKFQKNQ